MTVIPPLPSTAPPAEKYPGKAHARRVVEYLSTGLPDQPISSSILYLESAQTRFNEDSDHPAPFRQRRYFYYLTGCELPDSAYVFDVAKERACLFIPGVVEDEVVWSGLPMSPQEAMEKYDVDEVRTSDQINTYLSELAHHATTVFAIDGQVSPSVTFLPFSDNNLSALKPAIEEVRAVKDPHEVSLIRHANAITDAAHRAVMHAALSARNERELWAVFTERCTALGSPQQAYDAICASGTDAATLHYIKNNKPIAARNDLLLLCDAGAEYDCYASDVTRTFPLSGSFTPRSGAVYRLVLRMQSECLAMIRASVRWEDVHVHAHRVAIDGLLALGILKGGTPDELFDSRVSTAFMPHGLGHYLGMDTHDTGGHADYADPDPMFRYLRVRGKLPAGAVITVEPGIYFCRFIIEPALRDPEKGRFIDEAVLEEYWSVGGVRIEDNVVVTEEGCVNLTTVPKEVEQIEALVKGGAT